MVLRSRRCRVSDTGMSTFDEHLHPRGGDPHNRGRFSTKHRAESDLGLARHAADSPTAAVADAPPRHAAATDTAATDTGETHIGEHLDRQLAAAEADNDRAMRNEMDRWPESDQTLQFPFGPMVSNINMHTGEPDFVRYDADGNSRPVMPRLPHQDRQQVDRMAGWLVDAGRHGRHPHGYRPADAALDVDTLCHDTGIRFQPGTDHLTDDLEDLSDRVNQHDADGTRDTLARIHQRQQQAQMVQPQVFDSADTGWRPPEGPYAASDLADEPRQMYERAYGDRYQNVTDNKQLSKTIKTDLRQAQQAHYLPDGVDFSVRRNTFAGGQSIDITVTGPSRDWQTAPHDPGEDGAFGRTRSDQSVELRRRVQTIADRFNHNGSDIQTDYFDVRYYTDVAITPAYEQRR